MIGVKKLYWKLFRQWMRITKRMDDENIEIYFVLRQLKKHPDRWERKLLPGKVLSQQPKPEEKERWFREEMLCRPGNYRIESVD